MPDFLFLNTTQNKSMLGKWNLLLNTSNGEILICIRVFLKGFNQWNIDFFTI